MNDPSAELRSPSEVQLPHVDQGVISEVSVKFSKDPEMADKVLAQIRADGSPALAAAIEDLLVPLAVTAEGQRDILVATTMLYACLHRAANPDNR